MERNLSTKFLDTNRFFRLCFIKNIILNLKVNHLHENLIQQIF